MDAADRCIEDVPFFRIWLWGPLHVEKRVGDVSKVVQPTDWGGSNYPRLLLKALLCCPGRRGRREALLDMLWPESELEQATANLNTATTKLRTLLRPSKEHESLLITEDDATIYRLPGQQIIWVDSDDACQLLDTVERSGRMTREALPLLEKAIALASRGIFLEGEEGQWAAEKRAVRERERYRGDIWLVESYLQQALFGKAETILTALLERDPFDEDVLCRLVWVYHQQGMTHQALSLYQHTAQFFHQEGSVLTEATQQFVAQLQKERFSSGIPRAVQSTLIALTEEKRVSLQPNGETIVDTQNPREGVPVILSRRHLLQGALGATSTTFFPGNLFLDEETLELLSKALQPASQLDETTLVHLETITKARRFEFVQSEGRTWFDLFQEVSGHLRIVTRLLERHIQHPQLCTIAGETALLLGDLLFNAGENTAADKYYQSALEASKGNGLLQAVILGRRALLPIYDNAPEKAIEHIESALQLAPDTTDDMILAYLWSVKGEAYASLGAQAACFQALHSAEQLVERGKPGVLSLHFQPEIAYATFDQTKFAGYQGICFLRLNRSGAAQNILQAQLARVEERSLIHQQSIASVDLAMSFVQQASLRDAYTYTTNALTFLETTRSIRVFQRLVKLRQALHPWEKTTYVKNIDEHMHFLSQDLMKGKA